MEKPTLMMMTGMEIFKVAWSRFTPMDANPIPKSTPIIPPITQMIIDSTMNCILI